jgi:hypothetical protein
MDWRAEAAALLEQMHRAAGGPLLAIGALCTSIVLLLALLVLSVRHRRLHTELATKAPRTERLAATPSLDPQGEVIRTPLDRVLPRHPVAFYLLALGLSVGCWLGGLVLAPSVPRFLQSREWHVQPFYLAAHLIALRMFVRLFVGKYVAGAAGLDIPADTVANGIRRILGAPGGLAAAAIALPFCVLDYRYLVSDRYEKLSEDQLLHAIDYVMWGIWCAEWLLNALIWVTLAGFLAMSYWALRTHRFRAPIAVVVQEKLYRPFLQMSSQGATIVLGFACITAFYIWYAGGAVSDFLGLGVTGLLLVVGFIPSWLLLNAKVKRTVREEIEALRRNLPAPVAGEKVLGASAGEARARTVDERLDELVALMRAWHLERLQLDLGRSEAQALAVRLAAPAATAGWQLYSNLQGILGNVGRTIGSILAAIAKLFT